MQTISTDGRREKRKRKKKEKERRRNKKEKDSSPMIFPLDFDFLMVFFFSSAGAESEQKPVNLSVSEIVVLRQREGLTSGGACLPFSAVTQCLRSASSVAWIKNSKSKQRTVI